MSDDTISLMLQLPEKDIDKYILPEDEGINEYILEPTLEGQTKCIEEHGEATFNTVLQRENKIALGRPYYEELLSRYEAMNQPIPHEIEHLSQDYDFHFVTFSCSFSPDRDCKFDWARVAVNLDTTSKSDEQLDPAIAYWMFPEKITSLLTCDKTIIAEPLRLGIGIGSRQKEIVYKPKIRGGNKGRSNPEWIFTDDVLGIKQLFIIIQSPKGSKVLGRFVLGATVRFTKGLKKILIPCRTNKEAAKIEYNFFKDE
ncbi:MAG: hypothetical protein ACFFBD_28000 [Candidatus Hodarchaeota archaeon]